MQNYAVIGDHDEGTPGYKSDRALEHSLEILESIRGEGEDKAEWNMRMAYGHQYLSGQEEKAIPYAERWAELDPEDENAAGVIKECLEAIERRSDGSESDVDDDETGVFAGFVLLSRVSWSKRQLIRDLKELWDIVAEEDDDDSNDDVLVFEVDGRVAAISLMKGPIPDGEAEANAENNYMWPEAVDVAREHRAHLLVFVGERDDDDLIERGKLFVKLPSGERLWHLHQRSGVPAGVLRRHGRDDEGGRAPNLQLDMVRTVQDREGHIRIHLRDEDIRKGGDGGPRR